MSLFSLPITWFHDHPVLLAILGVFSLVMFFGTLLFLPLLIIRLPQDYFLENSHCSEKGRGPSVLRRVFVVSKNLLAALILLMGVLMLFLPGQGLLTMLIGLTLADFPSKRRLLLRLVRIPSVLRAINLIRAKRGKPPITL
ncbi:MAG: PGPGW domain-containing protein [Fibrobacterota bacterium]